MDDLSDRLVALTRSRVLLVGCDFDGTLSPSVSDPDRAAAAPGAIAALNALSRLPRTHVAVISGRCLADLGARAIELSDCRLIGSQGGEARGVHTPRLSGPQKRLLRQVILEIAVIARSGQGLRCERRPAGVALHYREASEEAAQRALDAVCDGPARRPGTHLRHGKKVIELSVVPINKGQALGSIREQVGATAVLFLGDDHTDEDAFAVLTTADLGVKIGPEPSLAGHRVAGPAEVARLLAAVARFRTDWTDEQCTPSWAFRATVGGCSTRSLRVTGSFWDPA